MRSYRHALAGGLVAALCYAAPARAASDHPAPEPAATARQTGPEQREIDFSHIWTGERLQIVYKTGETYDQAALARISWFLRDWRCSKSIAIDPALIDLLYDLHRNLGAKWPIRVLSGYRSEGLNASLLRSGRLVDPYSQHMAGKAVDVVFPGVPAAKLKSLAVARGSGGVGYYPSSRPAFVHVDTGKARDWEEAPGMSAHHKRLRLDCNLTLADAAREISLEAALKALPPGAASMNKEFAASVNKGPTAGQPEPRTASAIEPVAGQAAPALVAAASEETARHINNASTRSRRRGRATAKLHRSTAKCVKARSRRAECAALHKQKKKRRR